MRARSCRRAPRAFTVIVAGAIPVAAVLLTPALLAQESSETGIGRPGGESFTALVQKLESENWVPAFFASRVAVFDPVDEDRRLKEMKFC